MRATHLQGQFQRQPLVRFIGENEQLRRFQRGNQGGIFHSKQQIDGYAVTTMGRRAVFRLED